MLIDPPARRVRYFVVKSSAHPVTDRFLVSAEAIIRVEPESHIARLDPSNDLSAVRFDPTAARPFSDDDALTAMFSRAS